MKKVKIEIPSWYLSDNEKDGIQKNSVKIAANFRKKIHEEDEKLKELEKMHQGNIRIY